MKKMKKALFLIALAGGMVLSAQEADTQAATDAASESMNKQVQATQPISSSMAMDEEFEKFQKECGIDAYGQVDEKGAVYITGKATVDENVKSPDFIKSRTIAYEKAYMDAVSNLIMYRTGRNHAEQVQKIFDDKSTNKLDVPSNLVESESVLNKKMDALAEASVDQALTKMGVDPKQYEGSDLVGKKDLVRRSMLTRSISQAYGDAFGIVPVNTFETYDKKGKYTIGVVLRADSTSNAIAQCMAMKRRPPFAKKGISVGEAIPEDKNELITQFGVRIFYNKEGVPSLLSFGQFGIDNSGDEDDQSDAESQAFTQAEDMANSQITFFLKSKVALNQIVTRGQEKSKEAFKMKDGSLDVVSKKNITDIVSKEIKLVGDSDMSGRMPVKKKIMIHPSGHKVAVVVVQWSFTQHEGNQKILDAQKNVNDASQKSKQSEEAGKSGFRRGRTYDF